MAVAAIHPGEQLAEELNVLHMSAAELARKLGVPTKSRDTDFAWHAFDYRRHRSAPRSLLWHKCAVLA